MQVGAADEVGAGGVGDEGLIKLGRINSYEAAGNNYNGVGNTAIANWFPQHTNDPPIFWGSSTVSATPGSVHMPRNTWLRVDMYKKLSTAGVADGALAVWITGLNATANINNSSEHYSEMTREAGDTFMHDSVLLPLAVATHPDDFPDSYFEVYVDALHVVRIWFYHPNIRHTEQLC